jgi:2-polyprenyl-3-methyl-5-hydroxy-6-metoxy-1,4-benzoquinol methylase
MPALDHCPICESSNIALRFNGFTNRRRSDGIVWPVFECRDCGHGFMNPQPGPEVLNGYYDAEYEPYDDKHGATEDDVHVVASARRLGEFRHIPLPVGKKILDFGCGGGYFLRICRELGADVQGIEPSAHGAEITRRQGIPVFNGTLEQFQAERGGDRFDVITSNHVLEHVPDPVRTLAGLGSLLAPGGSITIAVPNARCTFAQELGPEWYSTDLPFHLHQFSAESLRIAAERAGLSTQSIGTTSLPASTAASLQLLLRQKYFVPRRLTMRLPLFKRYSERLATRHDEQRRGEALLARFS